MIEKNKTYLVTGGNGFLAQELISRIMAHGADVVALCRDVEKANALPQKFEGIKTVKGDLLHSTSYDALFQFPIDGVFHLAAVKDLALSEKLPIEAVKSNIIGTINILDYSEMNQICKFVVGASTFAADRATGVYGSTKFLTEKLFGQWKYKNPNCDYSMLRFGPLLNSPGSVLCKWKEALEAGDKIILTDPSAIRRFVSRSQVVDEMVKIPEEMTEMRTKSVRMGDLLEAFVQVYNNGDKSNVEITGLRVGEQCNSSGDEEDVMPVDELKKII